MFAVAFGALRSRLSRRPDAPLRSILCLGHSHVACVAHAAQSTRDPIQVLDFWQIPGAIRREPEGVRFSAAIEQQLRAHDGLVASMIGGAAPVLLGLLVHPRRFDFVLPSQPDLPIDPAAELVPSMAVQRLVEAHMAEYLAVIARVRELCGGRVCHVEPPPPRADLERVSDEIPWALFPDRRREVSPLALRYKLWRLHSQLLADWCADHAVELLPVPADAVDTNGCLLEKYCGDVVHANARYGALVLAQLRQRA